MACYARGWETKSCRVPGVGTLPRYPGVGNVPLAATGLTSDTATGVGLHGFLAGEAANI